MWDIFGQHKAVELLEASIEQQKLSHAYLVVGPRYIGKGALALKLAQAVNCTGDDPPCGRCPSCDKITRGTNSDVQVVCLKDGAKEISIDQIRELHHTASLKPYESKCRVFIIEGAGSLSTEAGNALLKTLEEPPQRVLLILTALAKAQIMATILSRCQVIELHPVAASIIEKELTARWHADPDEAKKLSRLCNGAIGWAVMALDDPTLIERRSDIIDRVVKASAASVADRFSCASDMAGLFSQDKEAVFEMLSLWAGWWRDMLLLKHKSDGKLINIDRLQELADMASGYDAADIIGFLKSIDRSAANLRRNVNARLALEVLMLDVPKSNRRRRGKEAEAVSF